MLGLGFGVSNSSYKKAHEPPFSLALNNTDDHGRIEHHASLKPTAGLTLSAWINIDKSEGGSEGWDFDNLGSARDHDQVVIGNIASGGYAILIQYAGTEVNPIVRIKGLVRVTDIGNGSAGYVTTKWGGITNTAPPPNNSALHEIRNFSGWVHIAFTYDGGVAKLYINGSSDIYNDDDPDGTGFDSSPTQVVDTGVTGKTIHYANNTKVFLGADPIGLGDSPSQPMFGGLLDEVAIYGTALTTSAIEYIYNGGSAIRDLTNAAPDSGYTSTHVNSLAAYYRMEEGEGNQVADSSANTNVATLINNPFFSTNTAK